MAHQTKFEAIRTQMSESAHSSMSSAHGIGDRIEVKPSKLSWWQASKAIGAVMDLLAIALSCAFFVYALAVKMHQDMPMKSSRVKLLLKLSNLGPTVYPILFAATIGRALKSIAFWKLERGGRIGTLDQLLGSMTIVQTVFTQIQLRSLSLLSLPLILLWSLSPLGGQASLRIIGTVIKSTNTTRLFQYVNTSSDILGVVGYYGDGDLAGEFVPASALFGAALVGAASSLSSSSSSIDTWGNTKIPWIESLDPSLADAEGWYSIPQLKSSDDFTSLIGIPLSMVPDETNLTTSFIIETSYWALSCPVFGNLDDGLIALAEMKQFEDPIGISEYNRSLASPNLYLYSTSTVTDGGFLGLRPDIQQPRHITYLENNNGQAQWVAANCTIRTTYVEVSMNCSTGSCTAVGMRESRNPCVPAGWTSFDVMGPAFYGFTIPFAEALTGKVDGATPYQKFIIHPDDPFETFYDIPPVTVVPNATFALRLGQLLNTYWMAMLAPTAIPKGLRNPNLADDAADVRTLLINTTATETRDSLVLECNIFWFVVLLLSSGITAFIGLCGLVAAICRRGPDIAFNISSLIKDSPFFDQTSVATTLSSTDRSRLMKDWYAKYGDVAPEDEVGYIAIGSGNVADLQSGRLYR